MISSLCWVPRGKMQSKPKVYILSAAEEEELRKRMTQEETTDQTSNKDIPKNRIDDEFDLDTYDDDDSVADVFLNNGEVEKMDDEDDAMDVENEDDMADLLIQDSDNVMIVAKAEEETSGLEIHLYNGETGDFYVHHDIPLASFPLCVEWLDCPSRVPASNQVGSYAAVGTFRPVIEIWDLDLLNAMEPHAVLGAGEDGIETSSEAHADAVLGLSWNAEHRNLIASCSADASVKVWDISKESCAFTLRHHKDKVGCVRWNPAETSVLATGSSDKNLCVVDVKSPSKGIRIPLGVAEEAESIAWNPFAPPQLLVSTSSGRLSCFDIRKVGAQNTASLFSIQAHEEAISCISFSPIMSGLLATASADQTVKLWDVQENKATMVTSKHMSVGPLFSVSFNPNSPFLLFCGGQEGKIAIWETDENAGVERTFRGRTSGSSLGDITTTTTTTTTSAATTETTSTKKKNKKKKGKKKRR